MSETKGKQGWTRGKSACPHSSDEVCGPCQRAIDLRNEMSSDHLTPSPKQQ